MQRINCFSRFMAAIFFLLCFVPSVFSATIDVMVVFDSTAKSWVDSNGGMNIFAVDTVARMNQATANSNVNLTFRLVYAAEVSYTHINMSLDLSRLQAGSGNLSAVHSWRNTFGADLVVMLVDTGSASGTVGMGYMLTTYSGEPDYAFSVSAIRSVDISHTMTHEIGHNLGCDHSKFQKSDPGPNTYLNTYSAGWYFTGTNGIPYNTIMAYSSDGYGNIYVEAPLFSTPLESYEGKVAGDTADGDNSRNIRETMDIVAAYLPSTISDPDQFNFIDQTDVALNTVVTSNEITVSGLNAATIIYISGGTYSINSGSYKSTSDTVNNGDIVTVRITSSGNYSTTKSAILTIGGVSDTFSVTTQAALPDTVPAQFTFTDKTGVALNTTVISNAITVSGINAAASISIIDGMYSINGGLYTNDVGTVNNGDAVTIQLASSGNYSTKTEATLTIGGVSDTFSVTTQAVPASGGSGGGGGGCFIATAAFGSALAGQVEILRQLRDRYLLTNAFGRKFVAWYYRIGPGAASYIEGKPLAKAAVRVALYPLIGFSLLLINGILPYLFLTGFILFFIFKLRKSFVT
ncbi:MAG: hypothetical protein CVU62_14585 [Deltaproteobacteria bacterium HGW-Deltaproteobacteria-2]|nr:MAG: hypothetical protein CVU62_14585 [Deltaproteobacteria bacterium HGW-Deltaproteobacteria-2]